MAGSIRAMTPALLLYGEPVNTVFDLLGKKENDLTKALGWGLSHSPRLIERLLANLASELGTDDTGSDPAVCLQEHVPAPALPTSTFARPRCTSSSRLSADGNCPEQANSRSMRCHLSLAS